MTELLSARGEVAATRVQETLYEISADARGDMRVPARIYADAELWDQIAGDRSLEQLMNVATLPGVTRAVYAMPDAHEGYGFPVGGVAAFRTADGIISPGGVGYDINCGVRLLLTDLDARDLGKRLEPLVHELSRSIPSGTGRGGKLQLSDDELDSVFVEGGAICSTPSPAHASPGLTHVACPSARGTGGGANWGPWVPATTSWRWSASRTSSIRMRRRLLGWTPTGSPS
jgi:tRNA-splicing ligase RtcB